MCPQVHLKEWFAALIAMSVRQNQAAVIGVVASQHPTLILERQGG